MALRKQLVIVYNDGINPIETFKKWFSFYTASADAVAVTKAEYDDLHDITTEGYQWEHVTQHDSDDNGV
jgi:hypothetical protein